jgi:glutathione S-transferase
MIVHHLSNSHSHVILCLLEELGVDYSIVPHQRNSQTNLSPASLQAIHPVAKAPTIEDQGVVMIESTGIILYVLEKYGGGRLRPSPGTADAMRFYQWLTFIEGSAKAPLMGYFQKLGLPAEDPARMGAERHMRRFVTPLETALAAGGGTLVPSMFTAADIQLAFFEELMEGLLPMDEWPNMQAHLQQMRQRDAYRRAEAKGGPVGLKELFARAAAMVGTTSAVLRNGPVN